METAQESTNFEASKKSESAKAAVKTRRKNKRDESQFSTEFHRGSQHMGFHRIPVPDSASKFKAVKKVYDLALLKDGLLHSVELKQTRTGRLKTRELADHQALNLTDSKEKGGMPWVVCVFHGSVKRVVYAAYAGHFINAKNEGRPSLHLDWWKDWGVQLPQIKAPILDPDTFRPKLYENKETGEMEFKLARSWDPTPMHEAGERFLEREWRQSLYE